MAKKDICELRVCNEEFNKIKKNKQFVTLQLNDSKLKNINIEDTIIFINETNNKIKRKVTNLYTYDTFEDALQNINNEDNNSYIYNKFSKKDIKKYGVLGIGLEKTMSIFNKVILLIFCVLLFLALLFYLKTYISTMKSKSFSNELRSIEKQKINYIFVEINPSFVLAAKDNKVIDVACLNDDCISLYDNIDVLGKSVDESISSIYILTKNKGFDVSNGVKIKMSSEISYSESDYISVEYIDIKTEKEILSTVINNDSIKKYDNSNYYEKLWAELKKDSDYGKLYTCNMDENELKCYFIMNSITMPKLSIGMDFFKNLVEYTDKTLKISTILTKFGIENKYRNLSGLKIFIATDEFSLHSNYKYTETDENNKITKSNLEMVFVDMDSNNNIKYFYIEEFNLLDPFASLRNAFTINLERQKVIYRKDITQEEIKQIKKEAELWVDKRIKELTDVGYTLNLESSNENTKVYCIEEKTLELITSTCYYIGIDEYYYTDEYYDKYCPDCRKN